MVYVLNVPAEGARNIYPSLPLSLLLTDSGQVARSKVEALSQVIPKGEQNTKKQQMKCDWRYDF